MLDEKVAKELAFLKQENLYRKVKTVTSIKKNKILINSQWQINFASNDYLGLSQNNSIKKL